MGARLPGQLRYLRDPGQYVIAAAMLCGIANVPVWLAVPAAVVGLQALFVPKNLALFERAQAVGFRQEHAAAEQPPDHFSVPVDGDRLKLR